MTSRKGRKRKSEPEISVFERAFKNDTSSNTVGRKSKGYQNEGSSPSLFNIHIHLPPMKDQKLSRPCVQPQIHLHFNDLLGSLKSGDAVQSLIQNKNAIGNLKNLFSMVTHESDNLKLIDDSSENDNNSSVRLTRSNSLKKIKHVVEEENNVSRRGRKRRISSVSNTSTPKRHKDNSQVSSLENKLKRLVQGHVRKSLFNYTNNRTFSEADGNLWSNYNTDNSHKLKKAVVMLKDIGYRKQYHVSEFENGNVTEMTDFERSLYSRDSSSKENDAFEGKTSTPNNSPLNKKKFFEKLKLKEDNTVKNSSKKAKKKYESDGSLNENEEDSSDEDSVNKSSDFSGTETDKQNTKRKDNEKSSSDDECEILTDDFVCNDQENQKTVLKVSNTVQKLISKMGNKNIVSNNNKSVKLNNQSVNCNEKNADKDNSEQESANENVNKESVSQDSPVDEVHSDRNDETETMANKVDKIDDLNIVEERTEKEINSEANEKSGIESVPETQEKENVESGAEELVFAHNEKDKEVDGAKSDSPNQKEVLVEGNNCEEEKSEYNNASSQQSTNNDAACILDNKKSDKEKKSKINAKAPESGKKLRSGNRNSITEISVSNILDTNVKRRSKANTEKEEKTSKNKDKKGSTGKRATLMTNSEVNVEPSTSYSSTRKPFVRQLRTRNSKNGNHLSDTSDEETEENVPMSETENAFWSVKRRNGRIYSLVYKSDSEDSQDNIKSLTSLANNCNFSEILKKIKTPGLRKKIMSLKDNGFKKQEEPQKEVTNNVDECQKNSSADQINVDDLGVEETSSNVEKMTPQKKAPITGHTNTPKKDSDKKPEEPENVISTIVDECRNSSGTDKADLVGEESSSNVEKITSKKKAQKTDHTPNKDSGENPEEHEKIISKMVEECRNSFDTDKTDIAGEDSSNNIEKKTPKKKAQKTAHTSTSKKGSAKRSEEHEKIISKMVEECRNSFDTDKTDIAGEDSSNNIEKKTPKKKAQNTAHTSTSKKGSAKKSEEHEKIISKMVEECQNSFDTDKTNIAGEENSNNVEKKTPKRKAKKTDHKTSKNDTILDSSVKNLVEDSSLQSKDKESDDAEGVGVSSRELRSRRSEDPQDNSDRPEVRLEDEKKEMLKRGSLKKNKNGKVSSKKASSKKRSKSQEATSAIQSSSPPKKIKSSDKKIDVTPKSKKSKKQSQGGEDYIPLNVSGPTKFAVAPLNKIKPYKKHDAASLKNKLIFSSKNKRYSSPKEHRVYKEKQAAQKASRI